MKNTLIHNCIGGEAAVMQEVEEEIGEHNGNVEEVRLESNECERSSAKDYAYYLGRIIAYTTYVSPQNTSEGLHNFHKFSVHWNHRNRWGHLLFPLSSLQHPGLDDVGVTLHHLLCSILDLAFSSSPEGFEEGANHKVSYLAPHSDGQCYFCVPVLHVYQDVVRLSICALMQQIIAQLC